jgi:hypothetical protein
VIAKNLFISQLGACTRTLNAQLKQQIIQVGAVDTGRMNTGRMKNTVKVKVTYDFQREIFYIQSSDMAKQVFYYLYVDKGTIHIKARDITDKTLERPKVQAALDRLYNKWLDYILDRQFE